MQFGFLMRKEVYKDCGRIWPEITRDDVMCLGFLTDYVRGLAMDWDRWKCRVACYADLHV